MVTRLPRCEAENCVGFHDGAQRFLEMLAFEMRLVCLLILTVCVLDRIGIGRWGRERRCCWRRVTSDNVAAERLQPNPDELRNRGWEHTADLKLVWALSRFSGSDGKH